MKNRLSTTLYKQTGVMCWMLNPSTAGVKLALITDVGRISMLYFDEERGSGTELARAMPIFHR